MIDPKTVIGLDPLKDQVLISKDIKGVFSFDGLISYTGTMYQADIWKAEQAAAMGSSKLGRFVKDHYRKLGWLDVLAFVTISSTFQSNPFTGRFTYKAGDRYLDELSLIMIASEIVQSDGSKDWNTIIRAKSFTDPIKDNDTVQNDSPFNPDGQYYNPDKPVFTYDPDNGYIIYKNGEIIWTKTGGVYFDKENGAAVSYDVYQQTVRFSTGVLLNLKTLVRTAADGSKSTVTNELPWYQKIARLLLSDTKTQLMVLGSLIILLIVKSKRNG
jgi:hypothetical protein